ncbi:MAG: hypothetical protein LUH55_11315 [Bacteroides thetaiotaomicron]|nr:hypothetical protein [Bacteroides thetaiotaomicron]
MESKKDFYEKIECYQKIAENELWYMHGDFSIALEADWLVHIIENNYALKTLFSDKTIALFNQWRTHQNSIDFVLGGFSELGSFCYTKDDISVTAPIKLHGVENGYDEGYILFALGLEMTDESLFHQITEHLPLSCKNKSIQWAYIFICKYIVLAHCMDLSGDQKKSIKNCYDYLSNILS